jgi:hypothetical protein
MVAIKKLRQKLGWAVGLLRPPRGRHGRVNAWGGVAVVGKDWVSRCGKVLRGFDVVLQAGAPKEVIIEMPRSWDTGRGVGAKASGAILKLMFFVGRLAERAQASGARVGLLGAGIWQGQLPKSVIYDRMDRRYDLDFPSDEKHWDISDAIGLLHYSHEMARKIKWLH